MSLTRRAASVFVPVLRECMTWTSTDWSFSCLEGMGCWGSGMCCDLSRLSSHLFQVLTTQTWLLLQWVSVCPAGPLPVSSFPLDALAHTSPMTFLMFSYCLSAPCISNSVYQVGSVCLGNTNEKLELLSDVGLMVQVAIFFPIEKCLGVVCCFLLHCFCVLWRGTRQMTKSPQDCVW